MHWDIELFRIINAIADSESLHGRWITLSSAWGDVFFFMTLVVLLLFPAWRRAAVYGFAAAGVSVFASRAVSLFYHRDRPFVSDEFQSLLYHIESNSFPSDHAAAAFGIAVMLFYFSKRLGSAYIGFAALVSFSRIWVGVHYPLDVAAGAVIGITAAIAAYALISRYALYDRGIETVRSLLRRDDKRPPLSG